MSEMKKREKNMIISATFIIRDTRSNEILKITENKIQIRDTTPAKEGSKNIHFKEMANVQSLKMK